MLAAAGVDGERQVFRTTSLRPQAAWQVVAALVVYCTLAACGATIFSRLIEAADNPALLSAPIVLAGLTAFGVYALMARTTVSVGTDGIEIRRAFRTRFVRLDELRDVNVDAKALRIALANGELISLVHGAPVEPIGHFGRSDVDMDRALIGNRIVDVVRAHKARGVNGAGVLAPVWCRSKSSDASSATRPPRAMFGSAPQSRYAWRRAREASSGYVSPPRSPRRPSCAPSSRPSPTSRTRTVFTNTSRGQAEAPSSGGPKITARRRPS